jgi:hypothetical protein
LSLKPFLPHLYPFIPQASLWINSKAFSKTTQHQYERPLLNLIYLSVVRLPLMNPA